MTAPEQPDAAAKAAAERAAAAGKSRDAGDDPEATEPGNARSNPPEGVERSGGNTSR